MVGRECERSSSAEGWGSVTTWRSTWSLPSVFRSISPLCFSVLVSLDDGNKINFFRFYILRILEKIVCVQPNCNAIDNWKHAIRSFIIENYYRDRETAFLYY